jgi:hypothetical protein
MIDSPFGTSSMPDELTMGAVRQETLKSPKARRVGVTGQGSGGGKTRNERPSHTEPGDAFSGRVAVAICRSCPVR